LDFTCRCSLVLNFSQNCTDLDTRPWKSCTTLVQNNRGYRCTVTPRDYSNLSIAYIYFFVRFSNAFGSDCHLFHLKKSDACKSPIESLVLNAYFVHFGSPHPLVSLYDHVAQCPSSFVSGARFATAEWISLKGGFPEPPRNTHRRIFHFSRFDLFYFLSKIRHFLA
jgi:hypothetical protein